jgi:hypothetical protein
MPLSPEEAWRKRVRIFAIVILVCSIGYLVLCVLGMATRLLTVPLMRLYFTWLEGLVPGARFSKLMEPMENFMEKIAIWEMLRTVPFVIAAGWLVVLGRRLLRQDRSALAAIRTWCYASAAPIVISVLIQLIFVLPATLAYSEAVSKSMPMTTPHGSSAAMPFDISTFVSTMTNAATGAGIIIGAMTLAIFPLVLFFWSKKLSQDAPA